MKSSNLIKLNDFRELKETRHSKNNYQRYLRTLSNFQIETEINFLLDEFSSDSYDKDFFFKVELIQDEIISRADDDWKIRIRALNQTKSMYY